MIQEILNDFFFLCSDGVACFNKNGSINYFNNSFRLLSGYSSDLLKGMNLKQLLSPELSYNELLSDTNEKKYTEVNLISSSGLSIPAILFKEINSSVSSFFIFINNENISSLTTEINKELTVINNCLKNLKQDLGGDINGKRDYLSVASDSCFRLTELLNRGRENHPSL